MQKPCYCLYYKEYITMETVIFNVVIILTLAELRLALAIFIFSEIS